MALPKSYLTSTKNLGAIFEALQQAKAPERFTVRFLESLEFKSAADRLIVGVLKTLGMLDDQGRPTQRYFEFLDQTQSAVVLAESIRETYSDLFAVNINAQALSKMDVINKFKTLLQGSVSEAVLDKMALTFQSLVKLADFSVQPMRTRQDADRDNGSVDEDNDILEEKDTALGALRPTGKAKRDLPRSFGGLHYNIQIILPETRDPQVYDALFRSLREHLFA